MPGIPAAFTIFAAKGTCTSGRKACKLPTRDPIRVREREAMPDALLVGGIIAAGILIAGVALYVLPGVLGGRDGVTISVLGHTFLPWVVCGVWWTFWPWTPDPRPTVISLWGFLLGLSLIGLTFALTGGLLGLMIRNRRRY